MLTVKVGETAYEFDVDEQLKTLTGIESALVEEFVGGWGRFDVKGQRTRSLIVIVWMAMRSAGEAVTLEDVAEMPGLVFGGLVSLDDDGEDEIANPMEDPGRPLDETNASAESTGGSTVSAATTATSGSTGIPRSPTSTD